MVVTSDGWFLAWAGRLDRGGVKWGDGRAGDMPPAGTFDAATRSSADRTVTRGLPPSAPHTLAPAAAAAAAPSAAGAVLPVVAAAAAAAAGEVR